MGAIADHSWRRRFSTLLACAAAAWTALVIVALPASAATTWQSTAPLPAVRAQMTATLLPNGEVLAAGGMDTVGVPQSSAYLYSPVTQSWTPTASMNRPRAGHIAVLLPDGTVLVAGGQTVRSDGSQTTTATAEVFNPAKATWKRVGAMNDPRNEFAATVLTNGKVLVEGGANDATQVCIVPCPNLYSAELFDPAAESWTLTGSMHQSRDEHAATLLPSGDVLVDGGYRGFKFDPSPQHPTDPLADSEVYVVATGKWRLTGDLIIQRTLASATPLADGRVLAVGGYPANTLSGTPSATTPDAEIYDPNASDPTTGQRGAWSPVTPMPLSRAEQSATLLGDGRVLISGGELDTNTPLASTLLFDPATETWADAGSMVTARDAFPTVRLSSQPCGSLCNDVLAVGGENGYSINNYAFTASAEVFTPPPPGASPGSTTAAAAAGVPVPDTGMGDGWPLVVGAVLAAAGAVSFVSRTRR